MSDYCAIDKKPVLPDISSVYPIKEFGRFAERANSFYNEFDNSTTNNGTLDPLVVQTIYDNTNYLTDVLVGNTPGWVESGGPAAFPFIARKIDETGTQISVLEIDYIIAESVLLTPINFRDPSRIELVLISYETYLRNGGFTRNGGYTQNGMGGFCSLVPSIFAGLKQFSSFFNNMMSIANDIIDTFNGIKNFTAKALIERLKNMLLDTVTKIFEDKMQKLEQFVTAALNIQTTINSAATRILSRISKVKGEIESIFSAENLKKIKAKIEGLITYAVGVFERKDIEEIEFLVYRFCNLMQMLEQDSNNIFMRLKTFSDSYDYAMNTTAAAANANTARAIQAGAFRLSKSDLSAGVTRTRDVYTQAAESKDVAYIPPISTADVDGVTPFNDAKGDHRIGFQGGWVPKLGKMAWDHTDIRAKTQLMRLQQDFGRRLIVNSCYRTPEYNAAVGGAKGSKHMRGEALDMTWDGFRGASTSEKRDFIKLAQRHGFLGFGGYAGFIHIDLGPARFWGIRY